MRKTALPPVIITLLLGLLLWAYPSPVPAAQIRVLVVMSYAPGYGWGEEIKAGIVSVLSGKCKTKFFYLDTKNNFEGGVQKAKEAYNLYNTYRPHGVIAADDNAQSMFVVPYMKDKVKTPVIFCGVNTEAEKYGYPASNVTGILERHHLSESLALAKQLLPEIKTFGVFTPDNTSGRANLEQFQQAPHTYPVTLAAYKLPKTLMEMKTMAQELRTQCDILYSPTMHGLFDANQKPVADQEAIPILAKTFGKPVIGGNGFNIKFGLLCGVVKTGQEQGATAAEMLLKAMQGTPVNQLPITTNQYGKAIINVTVMNKFGIKPRPILLKGTQLVETEQ